MRLLHFLPRRGTDRGTSATPTRLRPTDKVPAERDIAVPAAAEIQALRAPPVDAVFAEFRAQLAPAAGGCRLVEWVMVVGVRVRNVGAGWGAGGRHLEPSSPLNDNPRHVPFAVLMHTAWIRSHAAPWLLYCRGRRRRQRGGARRRNSASIPLAPQRSPRAHSPFLPCVAEGAGAGSEEEPEEDMPAAEEEAAAAGAEQGQQENAAGAGGHGREVFQRVWGQGRRALRGWTVAGTTSCMGFQPPPAS